MYQAKSAEIQVFCGGGSVGIRSQKIKVAQNGLKTHFGFGIFEIQQNFDS